MPVACDRPAVFTKEGYRFFFYSNDHQPIRVHVRYGDGEAVFNVEAEVVLRELYGLKVRELAKAESIAKARRDQIIAKWHEYFP